MTSKKYSRREFLKYLGKVGAGVAIGGTIGNLIGRGYKHLIKPPIDAVYEIKETVENTVEKPKEYVKDKYHDIKKFLGLETEQEQQVKKKSQEQKRKEEEISRRSFFRRFLAEFHEHPTRQGTIIGASYGGIKSLIAKYPKYLSKKKVAKLMDENLDLKEKIKILEQGYQDVSKRIGELGEKYDIYEKKNLEKASLEIQGVIEELNEKEEEGGLEKKTSDNTGGNVLMILGGLGMLSIILTGAISMTGKIVLNQINTTYSIAALVIFVASIFLLIIGARKKRK